VTTPDCGRYAATGQGLTVLQRHLPIGLLWDAYRIQGTNAYRLWKAIGDLFDGMSAALCALVLELNPFTTERMITEWERAVGLPDVCLPDATTLDERRAWVVWRLAKRRWTTAAEWHELAALFGLEIRITPGWHVQKPALYAAEYPKRYDRFPKLGRFRVYIDVIGTVPRGYTYGAAGVDGYPIPYGVDLPGFDGFRCIIDRVRPANVVVIWNDNPLFNNCLAETFSDEFSDTFCGSFLGDG